MHTDIEKLKGLQEMDAAIVRLQAEIAELPRRVILIEGKLAEIKAQMEQSRTALKNNELTRRKFEHDIQSEQQKTSKYRDQLLEVKTNEQYKALQHEIEFAEKAIRGHEDRILQSMEENERLEKSLKAAEAELKQQTAEVEREKSAAHARTEQDQIELSDWSGKRSAVRAMLTAEILEHYDRVLAIRKTALAEARAQKCSGCNVLLRPQMYDEVRSNQRIITCDSCSRILYYDPAHEPPAEPVKATRKRKSKEAPSEAAEQEAAAASAEAVSDEPAPVR